MLAGVDTLVFDLQDAGCRFYTYLYTLLYALQASAKYQIPLIVLDRPNPLGGEIIEGNILDEEFTSFVGYPIPIRYGLTIGEMALYFNNAFEIHAPLTVVPMTGWRRDNYMLEQDMVWVPPSPNIPKIDTTFVYPGTCFVEGTNLSEGRGTTLPFEVVGAPFIDAEHLADVLNSLDLPGVRFRPTTFVPTFSKHQGQMCHGVQLHVLDRRTYQTVRTGLCLIETVAQLYKEFAFLTPPKEGQRHFFDLLTGTDQVRTLINNRQPLTSLFVQWEDQQAKFRALSEPFRLY
jgi:beta-N-acetylhexosaminidase